MTKQITLQELTEQSVKVSIKYIDKTWNKNTSKIPDFTRTLKNNNRNREFLENLLDENLLNQLMEMWGDTPYYEDDDEGSSTSGENIQETDYVYDIEFNFDNYNNNEFIDENYTIDDFINTIKEIESNNSQRTEEQINDELENLPPFKEKNPPKISDFAPGVYKIKVAKNAFINSIVVFGASSKTISETLNILDTGLEKDRLFNSETECYLIQSDIKIDPINNYHYITQTIIFEGNSYTRKFILEEYLAIHNIERDNITFESYEDIINDNDFKDATWNDNTEFNCFILKNLDGLTIMSLIPKYIERAMSSFEENLPSLIQSYINNGNGNG